jgi:hypothetical protein
LRGILKARGQSTALATKEASRRTSSPIKALDVVLEAITKTGRQPGEDAFMRSTSRRASSGPAPDATRSRSPGTDRTSEQMIRLYEDWPAASHDRVD